MQFDDFGERDDLRRARSKSIFEEMEEDIEKQRRQTDANSFAHPRGPSIGEMGREGGSLQRDKEGFELFNDDIGTAEDLDLLFNSDFGR